MSSKELRIGIIGAVHDHFWPVWGKGTFHEVREQPGVKLVAATEAHPQLQARLRADLGIDQIYTDYNEMFEKEKLDGVLVALPSNAKLGPIRAAARRGVHIMVDKPLCTTLDEAYEIRKIVSETDVKLIVNSISIWKEPLRKGLDLVQQGAIGRPFWVKWRNALAPKMPARRISSPTGSGIWRRTAAAS
jgi:predicted dehydrogenase